MKTRKLISALCAVSMLLSALPFASAADVPAPAEHAGQTVTCQVFDVQDDGSHSSRLVSVSIPANATQEEEIDLLHSAAGKPENTSRAIGVYEVFGTADDATFNREWTRIVTGKAKEAYSSVDVYFSVDFTQTNVSGAEFRLFNENYYSNTESCTFNETAIAVIFRMPSGNFKIAAGDTVSLDARTSSGGRATITNCILWGWNK